MNLRSKSGEFTVKSNSSNVSFGGQKRVVPPKAVRFHLMFLFEITWQSIWFLLTLPHFNNIFLKENISYRDTTVLATQKMPQKWNWNYLTYFYKEFLELALKTTLICVYMCIFLTLHNFEPRFYNNIMLLKWKWKKSTTRKQTKD